MALIELQAITLERKLRLELKAIFLEVKKIPILLKAMCIESDLDKQYVIGHGVQTKGAGPYVISG